MLLGALLSVILGTSVAFADEADDDTPAPAEFKVQFESTAGDFTIKVTRDLAPEGADRFWHLVRSGFYDGAPVYRVLRGFVAQWGLSPDPASNAVWQARRIPDDPVRQSNRRGTIVFAHSGPGTRTTQVFVNLSSNPSLDDQGFAPFGKVTQGFGTLKRMYALYGDSPQQIRIREEGEAYLEANWPRLDRIERATVLD
jgi:peptidyl-prolyl cis-trans isomerase A (cyclophilin A)